MSEATTSDILASAKKLFERQGFAATSMRQIADSAGIAKATIYHHFPDKTALFQAVLTQTIGEQRIDSAALAAEPDPRKRLRLGTIACLRLLSSAMELFQIARREVPEARSMLQSENASALGDLSRLFADSIRAGIDTGIFRPVDPRRAAQTLLAFIQGSYVTAALGGKSLPGPEQTADAMLDIYFHGIEKS